MLFMNYVSFKVCCLHLCINFSFDVTYVKSKINHVMVCYESSDFYLHKNYITVLNQSHADSRPVCT